MQNSLDKIWPISIMIEIYDPDKPLEESFPVETEIYITAPNGTSAVVKALQEVKLTEHEYLHVIHVGYPREKK